MGDLSNCPLTPSQPCSSKPPNPHVLNALRSRRTSTAKCCAKPKPWTATSTALPVTAFTPPGPVLDRATAAPPPAGAASVTAPACRRSAASDRNRGLPPEAPDPRPPPAPTTTETTATDPSRRNAAWSPVARTRSIRQNTPRSARRPHRRHQPADTAETDLRWPPKHPAPAPPAPPNPAAVLHRPSRAANLATRTPPGTHPPSTACDSSVNKSVFGRPGRCLTRRGGFHHHPLDTHLDKPIGQLSQRRRQRRVRRNLLQPPLAAGTRIQHTNSALLISRAATLAMICSSSCDSANIAVASALPLTQVHLERVARGYRMGTTSLILVLELAATGRRAQMRHPTPGSIHGSQDHSVRRL